MSNSPEEQCSTRSPTDEGGSAAVYAARPWQKVRPRGGPPTLTPTFATLLDAFRATARRTPEKVAICYFDGSLTYAQLDELSDDFAVWLADRRIGPGDRVMIILQNVPQFAITLIGAWKAGAAPTPTNPMYKAAELTTLFGDCGPRAIVCHTEQFVAVRSALDTAGLEAAVLTTSPYAFQTRNDPRALPPDLPTPVGCDDLLQSLAECGSRRPKKVGVAATDLGLLLYTSGTTGLPKGVMLSHGALAFNAEVSVKWFIPPEGSRLLAIAPLFHITGLVVHFGAALVSGGSIVITHRFQPEVVLDAILEHCPNVAVAAITAFIALMNCKQARPDHFRSFSRLFSGGAPIPPAIVNAFEARLGPRIHTSFGMTETSAPTHVAPWGAPIPIDPESGALAIGIPVSDVDSMILDDVGGPARIGQSGELLVRGPQLMKGYWRRPEETAAALSGGWMHTGDVGFMDCDGWFYLIDRKKDLINASGFKVSPREVEDVLYRHPAVREAAVIGVPDPYRGETVKAVVSLKAGAASDGDDLIAHCREFLAAYKAPRVVELVDELPKTVSGKIMRSALRSG